MKITTWLISLVILVASLTPCKDAFGFRVTTKAVISAESHSDTQHSTVMDSCSPFCVCACCSTPTVIKQEIIHQNISVYIEKEYTDLYSGSVASAFIAVWQPPKLG
ncbi:DUF6660 family protein [Pedobacter gandavensis]|uniref:DUF6660 family protein n=1 Tax=Pedobacter gandavensis TaxID=2679963 RepID=UPI003D7C2FCA